MREILKCSVGAAVEVLELERSKGLKGGVPKNTSNG